MLASSANKFSKNVILVLLPHWAGMHRPPMPAYGSPGSTGMSEQMPWAWGELAWEAGREQGAYREEKDNGLWKQTYLVLILALPLPSYLGQVLTLSELSVLICPVGIILYPLPEVHEMSMKSSPVSSI